MIGRANSSYFHEAGFGHTGGMVSGCRARIVTNPLLWATVLGMPKIGIVT